MDHSPVIFWEALQAEGPALAEAGRLYESAFSAAERIPWTWIQEAVGERQAWRPGAWSPHLLLAGERQGSIAGLAYGGHIPAFGGFVSYLAVGPRNRRRGIGSRLLRLLVRILELDAAFEGVSLPFVVWESRGPQAGLAEEKQEIWRGRLGLFASVGAWRVDGLTLQAPDFEQPQGEPVPLQLFLVPIDRPASSFDSAALREIAAGLLLHVYECGAGDPLWRQTFPPSCQPVLHPVHRSGG